MLFLVFIIVLLSTCSSKEQPKFFSCIDCHSKEGIKQQSAVKDHRLACTACHQGILGAKSKEEAHLGLVRSPSAQTVEAVCRDCHQEEVVRFASSLHHTYQRKTNFLLSRFGLGVKVPTLAELAKPTDPTGQREKDFVLDFLRRRCFTCHIYHVGESYVATRRGLGCLACHGYHSYVKPRNENCLSCHYSIRIGMDYLGLSPQNWYVDYRSPFVGGKLPDRPYGLEYYGLSRDVHADLGFACTTCHGKEELMYSSSRTNCLDCHQKALKGRKDYHHQKVLKKVSCAVCHAKFINQDELKVCELVIDDKVEKYYDVYVQESSDVEEYFLALDEGKRPKQAMRDGLMGELKDGLWLCFLEKRTFEKLVVSQDSRGRLCLKRKEKVIIFAENKSAEADLSICKVPHTIGRGDIMKSLEVLRMLNLDRREIGFGE